jgi:exodeoxyribonuclease VII small subunit
MNRRSPAPPEPPAGGDTPPFEVALKRLTEIVQTLEKGDLGLEDSLRLFEEGVKLARASQERLDAAEKRVEELLAVDDAGRAQTAAFPTDLAEGEAEAVDAGPQRPMAPR